MSENYLLTVVPPHTPVIKESGVMALAKKVSREVFSIIDGTSTIQRTREVPKLSKGGNRSFYRHFSSLILAEPYRLLGQKVIILDDITTSFNSMLACSQLVKMANAKKIIPLALGRTKPEKLQKRQNAIIQV